MHTTATLHVHPACVSNTDLIKRLQYTTGCLVILRNNKPRLVPKKNRPFPFDPNDGGRAA